MCKHSLLVDELEVTEAWEVDCAEDDMIGGSGMGGMVDDGSDLKE